MNASKHSTRLSYTLEATSHLQEKPSDTRVNMIPVVIGAFGKVTKILEKDWRSWKFEEDSR